MQDIASESPKKISWVITWTSGVTTDPVDPAVQEDVSLGGPKLWCLFFHTATERNLMSLDTISGVPKCSNMRFWLGLRPGPH